MVKAGSGMLTLGVPTSPGVPAGLSELTLTLSYNDFEGATALFEQYGGEIACLIIEPVVGNANCLPPREGYLQHLRDLCTRHGALLIFDEVMTGFRVALGGAQAHYGITPDLTTFGKVIGGGMPVGAYGGRRELLSQIAPAGPIYQAGTLSGNPGGDGRRPGDAGTDPGAGFPRRPGGRGECALRWPGSRRARSRRAVLHHPRRRHVRHVLHRPVRGHLRAGGGLRHRRVQPFLPRDAGTRRVMAPSAFEAGFMSSAHDAAIIEQTVAAAREAFKVVAAG